jgi:hypothetical protein
MDRDWRGVVFQERDFRWRIRRRAPDCAACSVRVDLQSCNGAQGTTATLREKRKLPFDSAEQYPPPTFDLFGFPFREKAHLIPNSSPYAAVCGIFSQAVLGVDIEAHYKNSKAEMIKALQQMAYGRKDDDRAEIGLIFSPYNLLMAPLSHKHFFDEKLVLLVVHILDIASVQVLSHVYYRKDYQRPH